MKSILIYTVHKAASMFLHKITADTASLFGIAHYSIHNENYYDQIMKASWRQLIETKTNRGCFGPIRGGEAKPNFPSDLNAYSVILHLRDPRDVLTSLFYSHTYSHSRRAGRFNPSDEQRKLWKKEGIDTFVLDKIPLYKERYEELISNLFGKENVIFLRYEDLVSDYASWLGQYLSAFSHLPKPERSITRFLGRRKNTSIFFLLFCIQMWPRLLATRGLRQSGNEVSYNSVTDERIFQSLYKKYHMEFNPRSENIYSHKRQITPGDHLRKLQPDTIEILNFEFRDVLDTLNKT